jgi:hypothetical protein
MPVGNMEKNSKYFFFFKPITPKASAKVILSILIKTAETKILQFWLQEEIKTNFSFPS